MGETLRLDIPKDGLMKLTNLVSPLQRSSRLFSCQKSTDSAKLVAMFLFGSFHDTAAGPRKKRMSLVKDEPNHQKTELFLTKAFLWPPQSLSCRANWAKQGFKLFQILQQSNMTMENPAIFSDAKYIYRFLVGILFFLLRKISPQVLQANPLMPKPDSKM